MSDEERARILRMVAEGKLSPEQAADLLEAIQPQQEPELAERQSESIDWEPEPPIPPIPPVPPMPEIHFGGKRKSRFLLIQIRDSGESKVNLRIPLGLTRAAGKFIPRQAQAYLGKYDINLQDLLNEISQTDGGTLLEIRDGENKVLIAVE